MEVHHVIPQLIDGRSTQYVMAYCRCPLDARYGLEVHIDDLSVEEKRSGECHIHCDNCGTNVWVGFRIDYEAIGDAI